MVTSTGNQKYLNALEEAEGQDDVQEFFEQLLNTFYEINFYNLLHWQGRV